jgi:hypothetical protein
MLEYFEMRWPVEDAMMTRSELMEEAYQDILEELPRLGLVPMSAPVYRWHPERRELVARLAVTPERIPAFTLPPGLFQVPA